MTKVVLGEEGSKRRWRLRFLFLPLLLSAALALMLAGGALAVHDLDFQLDGETTSTAFTPPPGATPSKDWNDIFNADGSNTALVGGAGSPFKNADFTRDFGVKVSANDTCSLTNTVSTTFCTADGTTFATGSKDTLDIPGWQCNRDNNVNSKIDIMNAYAAAYTASNGDKILYFGMEKNKNNGSNNVGFWFLQGNAGCVSPGGSVTWTGQHSVGDVLVVSEFSSGGGVSTITAYKWVGGTTPLVAFGSGGDCKTTPGGANDALCATTNATGSVPPASLPWNQNVTTKWLTSDATLGVGHTVVPPDFFEGGINLTKVFAASGGTPPACINTFIGDTRSSTSLTATLFDYARGTLGECSVTETTTPSSTADRLLGSNTPITDTATITGHSSSGGTAPTPTGSVTFFLCSPSQLTPANTGTCQGTSGTQVGATAVTVSPGPGAGQASATSVDAASLLTATGKYCFRAHFVAAANDPNYPGQTADLSTTADEQAECFTVLQVPTTTTTSPSDANGNTLLPGPVALGTTLYDKAVVQGTASGGNPTGSVNFFLCDPTQTGLDANNQAVCATGGTALSGNPRPLSPDANSSPPTSSVLSSPGVAANKAGVWCFRAVYVPSGSAYLGSSDASHGECIEVSKAPTTTVTEPRLVSSGQAFASPVPVNTQVTDHATITGSSADGAPTGDVQFYICNPTQVSLDANNQLVCAPLSGTPLNDPTAAPIANSSPPASSADSTAVTANLVGTWCFRAEYTPGGANGDNYLASHDASHGECFTVQDTSAGASVQKWLPNDHVTVSTTGGTALNGTLAITLRAGSCSGTVLYTEDGDPNTPGAQPITLNNTASGTTFDTNNTSVFANAANNANSPYFWRIVFTPTDPSLVTTFTKCETTSITVDDNP